tara:strand:+ start:26375 stop:26818 length:444 start_codon:yes stop_codon:yes gene_type:complete
MIKILLLIFISGSLIADKPDLLFKRSGKELVALTLLMEARGEEKGFRGMASAAQVIRNRMNHHDFPDMARAVVLELNQFSCWNNLKNDNYYEDLLKLPEAKAALAYAHDVIRNRKIDPRLNGELFYQNTKITGKKIKGIVIGNHTFY